MKFRVLGPIVGLLLISAGYLAHLNRITLQKIYYTKTNNYNALVTLLEQVPSAQRDHHWYFQYLTAQQVLLDSVQFRLLTDRLLKQGTSARLGLGHFWMAQKAWQNAWFCFQQIPQSHLPIVASRLKLLRQIRQGKQLIEKGNTCYNRGMLDSAEYYYQAAYTLLQTTPADYLTFKVRYNLILVQEDAGKLSQAKEAYLQVLNDLKGTGYAKLEINVLNNLGIIFKEEGEFKRARAFYQQALQLAQKTHDREAQAMLWVNLGNLSHSIGNFKTAIEEFQKAIKLSRKIQVSANLARALWNLSMVYFDQGQFQLTIEYLQKTLELDEANQDTIGICYDYFGLGKVYWRMGLWNRALEYLNRSLQLQEHIRYVQLKGSTLGQIAMIYEKMGLYARAEALCLQSLEVSELTGNHLDQIQTLHQLIELFQKTGHYQKARGYLDRYQRLVHRIQFFPGTVNFWTLKGELAIAQNQPDSARKYLNQLLDEIGQKPLPEYRIKAVLLLGKLALKDKNWPQAEHYGKQALEWAQAQANPLLLFEVYNFLSDIYLLRQRRLPLKSVFQAGLALTAAYASYATLTPAPDELFRKMRTFYKKYIYFCYRQGKLKDAIRAYLNSVSVFYSAIAGPKTSQDEWWQSIWMLNQQIGALHQLLQNEHISDRGRRGVNQRMQFLKKQLEEKWAVVQLRLQSETHPRHLDDNRDSLILMPGQAVVIPLIFSDTLLYLVRTREESVAIPIAIPATKLYRQVAFWKALMENDLQTRTHRLRPHHLKDFYQTFIAPVDAWLRAQQVQQICIALEDGLAFLPWNMAYDGTAYLTEIYQIRYGVPVQNGHSVKSGNVPPDTMAFLGMAPFPEKLPYSRKEIQQAAGNFPNNRGVFVREAATESRFKQQLPAARVIHLATHGQFSAYQPIFSYLQFRPDAENDGYVYLYELEPLTMNAFLVNLSVCRQIDIPASAERDAMFLQSNFAVHFIQKGARNVLVSPLALPDAFAADFNARFYSRLRDTHIGKAIQSVQTDFIRQGISPALWGNYFWLTPFNFHNPNTNRLKSATGRP